jgi:miniconductance mechanosensitive channel
MPPIEFFQSWLEQLNIHTEHASMITAAGASVAVLLISFIAYAVSRRIAHRTLPAIVARTSNTWGSDLAEKNVFKHLALLVPALIIGFFIPIVLDAYPKAASIAVRVVNIYLIIAVLMVLDALINALHAIYQRFKVAQEIPLTGFVQVLKIILYCVSIVLFIAILLDRTPLYLFSGLGAMTAVLMLIFKDPILGFVAGIQLITNRMLKQGDWIEMPKYGADGDVIDITLTTVKVRNWDRTITTIPTYALISDSFKNWRGMQESGGRRIKRAIFIDMSTIRFCSPQTLARFAKIRYIADYMERKNREIDRHNALLGVAAEDLANARRLTNIGTFRAYVQAYLQNHPMINLEMTFLVRQLAPCEHGLPLEIYVFCKDKAWANYEAVQADIFDHLLAIAPEFELRVFQYPSGHDLSLLQNRIPSHSANPNIEAA